MEKELEEVKIELQRLPGLERTMEHLAQNVGKMMQALEETRRAVAAFSNPKSGTKGRSEGDGLGSITRGYVPPNILPAAVGDQRTMERGKWQKGIGEAS